MTFSAHPLPRSRSLPRLTLDFVQPSNSARSRVHTIFELTKLALRKRPCGLELRELSSSVRFISPFATSQCSGCTPQNSACSELYHLYLTMVRCNPKSVTEGAINLAKKLMIMSASSVSCSHAVR